MLTGTIPMEPTHLKISVGGNAIALYVFDHDFVSDIIRRDGY